jgi:hypothetical protein
MDLIVVVSLIYLATVAILVYVLMLMLRQIDRLEARIKYLADAAENISAWRVLWSDDGTDIVTVILEILRYLGLEVVTKPKTTRLVKREEGA